MASRKVSSEALASLTGNAGADIVPPSCPKARKRVVSQFGERERAQFLKRRSLVAESNAEGGRGKHSCELSALDIQLQGDGRVSPEQGAKLHGKELKPMLQATDISGLRPDAALCCPSV